jgi:hypothetical protein
MADADVNQQGTADLQGLCEFSWSSLKHVEVMARGSFTFCKSAVFSERQLSRKLKRKIKQKNSFRYEETDRQSYAKYLK